MITVHLVCLSRGLLWFDVVKLEVMWSDAGLYGSCSFSVFTTCFAQRSSCRRGEWEVFVSCFSPGGCCVSTSWWSDSSPCLSLSVPSPRPWGLIIGPYVDQLILLHAQVQRWKQTECTLTVPESSSHMTWCWILSERGGLWLSEGPGPKKKIWRAPAVSCGSSSVQEVLMPSRWNRNKPQLRIILFYHVSSEHFGICLAALSH